MTHPKHSRNPALSSSLRGSSGQGLSSSRSLSAPIPQHMPIGRNKQAYLKNAIATYRAVMKHDQTWGHAPRKPQNPGRIRGWIKAAVECAAFFAVVYVILVLAAILADISRMIQ